jgi:hypothetical protein
MHPVQLSRIATLPKEAAEAEAASSMSWSGQGGEKVGGIVVSEPEMRLRWSSAGRGEAKKKISVGVFFVDVWEEGGGLVST